MWARLGYSLQDAGELAATTAKLLNVSEFASVDDATSALVSTLQAFTTEGQDVGQRAEEIVDILNNIGNRYPVATNELAEGLASSGAALVAANNSIEEQVALLSAGNATMQDVSTVAAGLKIVAARLRGTTTDIDDDAESAVTNVSKLQGKIKALTKEANGGEGIDIINEDGEYKSTYEILTEISKIFDKMDDVSQASLLELIAGKNRSSVVAAILQNGDILEEAYSDALNSEGSAQKELDTYLDSIQGRIDLFNNALQTMWMNLISSDVVKGVVDIGTALIKFLDTGIGKITVLLGLFKGFSLHGQFKASGQESFLDFLLGGAKEGLGKVKDLSGISKIANTFKTAFYEELSNRGETNAFDLLAALGGFDDAANLLPELVQAFGGADINLGEKILNKKQVSEILDSFDDIDDATKTAILNSGLFATAQTGAAGATNVLSASAAGLTTILNGLKASFMSIWASNPYLIIFAGAALAITAVAAAYEKWGPTHENAIKKLEKETEELQSVQDELKSVNSELESIQDSMNKLESKDKLTFVEEQELDRLRAVSAELERQKAILEAKESREKAQQIKAAVDAAEKDANLQGGANDAPVYAAISEKTGLVDHSKFNRFDANLNALERAKEQLAEAEAKLMEADNDDTISHASLRYKALQKDVEDAREAVERCNSALDTMSTDWQANYGEVGFISKEDGEELTAVEEKWNDIYRAYHDAMDRQALLNKDITKADVLERVFGKTGTEAAQAFKKEFASAFRRGEDPSKIIEQALANEDYAKLFKHILNQFGITNADLAGWFTKGGSAIFDRALVETKTYSALASKLENINEVQTQTQEILTNGTTVTQEYKDSLIGLVGSEEKVNECFVDGNSLVVKNADGLDDLLKISKKNISSQAKLAKTQARLKYAELYKELHKLTDGKKVDNAATRQQIEAIYAEMSALQGSIAQYTILEQKLLGASNAYERLAKAQEIDAANDYGSKAEELVEVLGGALKSKELGTEAAKVAISGLIPDDVIDKAKTLDEQMNQISQYFSTGEVSKLFTIKFDDDGGVESVEMTRAKVEAYVEELTSRSFGDSTVFQGTWDNFTLNPAITSLEEFADACNLTEEVAFAFLTELEKYDIGHLGGDNSTLLDQLMGDDFEYQAHKITEEMAKLEYQVSHGKISVEEYQKAMAELAKAQQENNQHIKDNVTSWGEASNEVEKAQAAVEKATRELEELNKSGASEQEIKMKTTELEIASELLTEALKKKYNLEEPTEMTIQIALDQANQEIEQFKAENSVLLTKVEIQQDENGKHTYTIKPDFKLDETEISAMDRYVGLLNEQYTINVLADGDQTDSTVELENVKSAAEAAQQAIANIPDPEIDASVAVSEINNLKQAIEGIKSKTVYINEVTRKTTSSGILGGLFGNGGVNGTAHASGTAHARGDWGVKKTETALVGELGPELIVDPDNGTWHTVGDHGAEFTQIKRGSIIFNHKQTEQLLKNGYVAGRGKLQGGGSAFASGTAYAYTMGATIEEDRKLKKERKKEIESAVAALGYSKSVATQIYNSEMGVSQKQVVLTTTQPTTKTPANSVNTWNGNYSGGSGSGGGGGGSDAKDEFEEVIDWVEIRIEEINEDLDLMAAKLENAVGYKNQNTILDDMISTNKILLENLENGAAEYKRYADKLLQEVPEAYREKAQDGAIQVEEFTNEADEKTVEAINNYREWTQKYADLIQHAEEVEAEIASLAKQKFDNVSQQYENELSIIENINDQLDAQVSLMEDRGYVAAAEYYESMIQNTQQYSEQLELEKQALQNVLDEQVKLGNIKKYSDEWYEMVDAIYEVDASIDDCTASLEEYQNAINDIYWDNFDELINRYDYLADETQNLIDLMENVEEAVADPAKKKYEGGTVEFWTEDDVKWTEEGLTSLGLYAQQMEIAEKKAKEYAIAIEDLNEDYKAGKYSETEYLEKLNELKDAQYDSIDAYYEAQDAIKDLNEARIDSIREGVEKEIEAYEELIDKKKEALDAEKDLYDFQKSVNEQQKDIAKIERQLAALQYDNSLSAIAKRKQLEAELAEANAELEETYYDRSIEDQKNALDKELEDFQEEKDAEIEKWEEYLDNIEQIVADSLTIVQANASGIYDTLSSKAEEYDLTLSEAILTPWQDGALAISDYQETFDTAASSTMDQLDAIKDKWQELIDKMSEAAGQEIAQQKQENATITAATKSEAKTATSTGTQDNTYTVKSGDTLWDIATAKLGSGARWQEIYNLNRDIISNPDLIQPGWKLKLPKYAKGTTGVNGNQLAIIDELGLEELVMHADGNGRLAFLSKGSAVIPHDISENLMALGQLDPQDILDRNRPVISAPHVTNNNIELTMEIAEVVHIDTVTNDTVPNLAKTVEKQIDKYMKGLNSEIRKFTR